MLDFIGRLRIFFEVDFCEKFSIKDHYRDALHFWTETQSNPPYSSG